MTDTQYLLSIDPGLATGVALLSYTEDSPAELVEGWQFGGGVTGFLDWVKGDFDSAMDSVKSNLRMPDIWISEKFQPINHSNYALTTASVEPLRVEGAMIALGLMPDYDVAEKRWRKPADQYVFGGKSKAEKKKAQHAWLKANGFYRTGKDLGTPDADDVRSAMAHGLSYLARVLHHKPTFDMIATTAGGGSS